MPTRTHPRTELEGYLSLSYESTRFKKRAVVVSNPALPGRYTGTFITCLYQAFSLPFTIGLHYGGRTIAATTGPLPPAWLAQSSQLIAHGQKIRDVATKVPWIGKSVDEAFPTTAWPVDLTYEFELKADGTLTYWAGLGPEWDPGKRVAVTGEVRL